MKYQLKISIQIINKLFDLARNEGPMVYKNKVIDLFWNYRSLNKFWF